ncbi:MAG: tRNA dihydrouridine synthase DusB [Clostridiales Family XIII bacterium]|jgi:tRNA-dihydrouridine synthase B|nr:tRNA dihydrouridine synthase DusB [Clostridiales Family XIII bacterium]
MRPNRGQDGIGGLRLENPFVLAPLAGITDAPFRRLCREQGAALAYAEMVSGKGLWYGDKKTESLLRIYDGEKPVGYQIFGREPEILAFAAETLDARENDILDINMGCPVPKVVRNGEGAALLREPELAGRLIEAAAAKTRKPVTAKIRIGWDDSSVNAVEMARTLEAAGAAAVAVHGRTREQYYRGKADWDVIRLVKAAVRIPVIGNGDVRCGADAVRMLDETGCDFVMIARGALGNPWIFRDACALYRGAEAPAPVSAKDRAGMLLRHLDMLIAEKGEYVAVREMRKHAAWYVRGIRGAAELRGQLNAACEAGVFRRAVESFAGRL